MKKTRIRTWAAGCMVVITVSRAGSTGAVPANAVTDWNDFGTVLQVEFPSPLFDGRTYAVHHAAIHDALNSIDRRYRRYTSCGGLGLLPGASPEAAVAQASRDVLVAMWEANVFVPPQVRPSIVARIEARLTAALTQVPDTPAKTLGREAGRACAAANLARRADDGIDRAGPPFSAEPIYVPGGDPGSYPFTPPYDAPPLGPFAFAPGWGGVTPFVIDLADHPAPAVYSLTSLRYAIDVNYLQAIGEANSVFRTAEQTEIARFWYELSPSGWNRITNTVLRHKGLGLWKAARILALVNFAMADGYIASFNAKYTRPFWRPITAIREAGADGNALTHADPGWTPLCETPPIPDHPSNHTLLGAAVATVLSSALGDRVSFETTSASLPGVTRRFRSFSEAAIENGLSRVYCGIHFVHAVAAGYQQGQSIGRAVAVQLPPSR